jgi:hypothetical protein
VCMVRIRWKHQDETDTETSMDLTKARARKWRTSSPEVASSESRPAVEAEG